MPDERYVYLSDEADPLGVMDLATHRVAIDDAPHAYEIFQKKEDGAIKILIAPSAAAPARAPGRARR